MTALKPRGGEPRAADTATTPPRPTLTIDQYCDDDGPFWVVTCTCGCPESPQFDGLDGGIAAAYWEAFHDLAHEDEWRAAS